MRRLSLPLTMAFWAAAGIVVAQTPPAAAPGPAKSPPPLEAYGRLPALEEIKISPGGDLLAFVSTSGDERVLAVERLSDRKIMTGFKVGNAKLRGLEWADDSHLLITSSVTADVVNLEGPRREWFMAMALDVATGKQKRLLDGAENAMNVILDAPLVRQIKGRPVLFAQTYHFETHQGAIGLFRIDLASGISSLVAPGKEDTIDWFVDDAGSLVAEARYRQASGRWSLLVNAGGWKTSKVIEAPIDVPSIIGYAKDGKSLLVNTVEDHKAVFHTVSLADGTWGPAEENPYDHLIFDASDHALLGGVDLEGDERTTTFFTPGLAAGWKAIEAAYPGERVMLASWSRNHRRVVVTVDGPRDGYGYALVDLDTHRADWIGDIYPDVPLSQIAEPRAIRYKAADGLEIPAYLTLPKGRAAKALPLIVMPHGGPADRDTLDFDWLREALVSRGYAVLQPNFRGSSGYTDDFLEAGYGQWGRKMQTDLSDGVRYLAAQGTIDPRRTCIFGWSYGGYAALAGAALDTGVYRCAADMAGPSDLGLMLRLVAAATGSSSNDTVRYWTRYMQVKGAGDPVLPTISPAAQAAKVEIPLLMVHGKDDTVVDYAQSQAMAAALKRAGKPYTLVTLDGEDHWGSRSQTRLQLLKAVMDFMLKNNPPDAGG